MEDVGTCPEIGEQVASGGWRLRETDPELNHVFLVIAIRTFLVFSPSPIFRLRHDTADSMNLPLKFRAASVARLLNTEQGDRMLLTRQAGAVRKTKLFQVVALVTPSSAQSSPSAPQTLLVKH